ncbi:hypothetical protein ACF06X_15855 [Streptomyces sp. NPDC015346]|uniref:hypothetical protein n=1 Tax=Streptomyces sp. NPDC015346 TaxID=3364954 RepID=UPI0036FBE7E7
MRTALRTALATALVAGVVITPAVTAGTAFADEAKPAVTATATVPVPGTSPDADTKSAPARTVPLDGGLTAQDRGSNGQGPATPVGDSLGKHKLADGTTGELWRKAKGWYTLELLTADGRPRGSVTAGGPEGAAEQGAQFGEMWVTLDNTGRIGSWLNRNLGTDYSDIREGCTVTRNSGSGFDDVSLRLVNSPSGAVARLSSDSKVLVTLTLKKPTGLAGGVWMTQPADAAVPTLNMRTADPKVNFDLEFPALPKGCDPATPGTAPTTPAPTTPAPTTPAPTTPAPTTPAPTTPAPTTPAPTTPAPTTPAPTTSGPAGTSTQTTVVPRGGVAAGAETGSVESANDSALMASGLGAAAVVAAGLGFLVLRRRSAAADRG